MSNSISNVSRSVVSSSNSDLPYSFCSSKELNFTCNICMNSRSRTSARHQFVKVEKSWNLNVWNDFFDYSNTCDVLVIQCNFLLTNSGVKYSIFRFLIPYTKSKMNFNLFCNSILSKSWIQVDIKIVVL